MSVFLLHIKTCCKEQEMTNFFVTKTFLQLPYRGCLIVNRCKRTLYLLFERQRENFKYLCQERIFALQP